MDKVMTDNSWRTVQLFLTPSGVFEVELNLESHDTRCNCRGWEQRGVCAHTDRVSSNTRENGGTYPIKISHRATEEDAEMAQLSKEAFREFVIKFGKIEVM